MFWDDKYTCARFSQFGQYTESMSDKFDDVEAEYEKNPELSRDDVAKIMGWCSKQPHLPKLNGEPTQFKFRHGSVAITNVQSLDGATYPSVQNVFFK